MENSTQDKKDRLYTWGFILSILSLVASLVLFFWIFAIPLFFTGMMLVWSSKKNIKTKVLVTFLPLALWFPIFMFFMGFWF
jgi:hypothetical protein